MHQTVGSQVGLDCCLQILSNEDQQSVDTKGEETSARFGNGKVFKSMKCVTLSAFSANKNMLKTEVIENDIPLLLSKDAVKKSKTNNDFSNKKITIFDEEVSIKFCTSGHYCIVVWKMNKKLKMSSFKKI